VQLRRTFDRHHWLWPDRTAAVAFLGTSSDSAARRAVAEGILRVVALAKAWRPRARNGRLPGRVGLAFGAGLQALRMPLRALDERFSYLG
jgi:hypothetical protein